MGAQGTGIGSIILGAVVGVVGVVTGQYYLLFSAFALIAGGAYSLAFSPKSPDQAGARSSDLQISTASVGNPVPVIFGTNRVTGNWLRWSEDFYRTTPIYAEQEGGKGGSEAPKQITGYDYALSWEYGLCMGEVDQVGQIYAMPGEKELIDSADPWTGFGAGDFIEAVASREEISGVVRIYKGTPDQVRTTTGDFYTLPDVLPHRNVCWCLFGAGEPFKFARSPTPPTFQFLVRRLPKAVRDDDTIVDGLQTRGALSSLDPAYWDANPAAVIYEILTNKVWGRGLSSDIIDEDSFIQASLFMGLNGLGMSFQMDAQENLDDVLEGIRRHVKTLITWDGEQYKLKCLLDVTKTHSFIQTLKSSEVQDVRFNRPLWENTINEVRAEFTSRHREYRPDVVQPQELANINALGGRIASQRIQLSGFTHAGICYRQAWRIMSEGAYPYMTIEFEINRFKSQIEIGDVMRIVWDEFGQDTVTSYWLILSIEEGDPDNENIKVTGIEDQMLSPIEGEELTPTIPGSYPWQRIPNVNISDIYPDVSPASKYGPLANPLAFEAPPIMTGGKVAQTVCLSEQDNGGVIAYRFLWSLDSGAGADFTSLGTTGGFAITGTLDEKMSGFQGKIRPDTWIEFTANNAVLFSGQLQGFNLTQSGEDDLETLLDSDRYFLVIGTEIMQVGLIELVGGDTFRMSNILRGRFGTRIQEHEASSVIHLMEQNRIGLDTAGVPQEEIFWKAYPTGNKGELMEGDEFQTPDGNHYALGLRPLPPEAFSITDNGSTVDILVRPRWATAGAEVQSLQIAASIPVVDLGGLSFSVGQLDDSQVELTGTPVGQTVTWTPGSLSDPDDGMVSITVTKEAGATRFRVFSDLDGRRSAEYAELTL